MCLLMRTACKVVAHRAPVDWQSPRAQTGSRRVFTENRNPQWREHSAGVVRNGPHVGKVGVPTLQLAILLNMN